MTKGEILKGWGVVKGGKEGVGDKKMELRQILVPELDSRIVVVSKNSIHRRSGVLRDASFNYPEEGVKGILVRFDDGTEELVALDECYWEVAEK